MESLLEKLYYGKEIITAENFESEESKSVLEEYIKLYNNFKSSLSNEQHDSLDNLLEYHDKLANISHQHYFRQGFKIAIKLLIESYN